MNNKEILEEFVSFFNWADQIKEEEIARWEIMYGCTPKKLLSEINNALNKTRVNERERCVRCHKANYFRHRNGTCKCFSLD